MLKQQIPDSGEEIADSIAAGPASLTPTFTTVDVGTGGYKVSGTKVVGAQAAAITNITITATTGSLPTAGNSQTIASATVPTVAELLALCVSMNAKITALNLVLHSHGLTA